MRKIIVVFELFEIITNNLIGERAGLEIEKKYGVQNYIYFCRANNV